MTMNQRNSFLGTGWAFPVEFKKSNEGCTICMVDDVEDIKQSLTILFSTNQGERVMQPNFGASLNDIIFEPVNEGLKNYLIELIKKAILYYEPRIELEKVLIDDNEVREGKITISLTFKVRRINSRFNFVYDYYKREATILSV